MEKPPRVLSPVSDQQRLFKIGFTLKYIECDLADKRVESNPVIQLYLSNHFVRNIESGGIVNITLDEDNLEKEYSGSLIGTLDRKHQYLSPTAAIGISSYAIHRADNGAACYVNVGTSHASIHAIVDDVKKHGVYDHTHDLIIRTAVVSGLEPIKKGVIELRINSVEYHPSVKLAQVSALTESPLSSIESGIDAYIKMCMDIETAYPDLLDGVQRVRAPYDLSQTGIESTGRTFLPIGAFALSDPPESNAEFFRNALECVMARRGMTIEGQWNDFGTREKTWALASVISFGVQTFDYISDAVETGNRRLKIRGQHVGTDEFSYSWITASGDCEDGGGAIKLGLEALKRVQFDSNDKHYHPLIELQNMAKNDYTAFMNLAVVRGQQISDTAGYGAHMYLHMIPNHQVDAALSKTMRGRKLLERLKPATPPMVGRQAVALKKEYSSAVCEGTGFLDPMGYNHPNLKQMMEANRHMTSMAIMKGEIPRAESPSDSNFYVAPLFGITNRYVDEHGIPIAGFIFGTVNPKYNPSDPHNVHEMVRGVLFTDVVDGNDNFALDPQPPMSPALMAIVKEAVTLVPPCRALTLDKPVPTSSLSHSHRQSWVEVRVTGG